jgi:hypothetical protein
MLRSMGMRTATLAVIATLALLPASALAADRYASTFGTNEAPCTEALPCDIATAINKAASGANITIEPGTYGPLGSTLADGGKDLTIHGVAGQARPVIDTTANFGLLLTGGSNLSDVEVDDTSTANQAAAIGVEDKASTVADVIGTSTGPSGIACYADGALKDSVCWASGADGIGATPPASGSVTATLRNDTLIASGTGGGAVKVNGTSLTTMTISLYNTIARGTGDDIVVDGASSDIGGAVVVTAQDSNFATVKNGGGGGTFTTPSSSANGNQSAAPLFADAAAGNFHELGGSPTVGAGADSTADGATDLDGNAREFDGKTDIGAYEYIPGPSCNSEAAHTKFATATKIQLACTNTAGGGLSYAITGGPYHGTASVNAATGLVMYTPNADYSGLDSFTYTASTSSLAASSQTVTIAVGKEPAPAISHAKARNGRLQFTLSEAAKVTLTFARHGHKNVTVKLKGNAGKNGYKMKKLKAGKYKLTIAASNAGGLAKSQAISLKIKR